MPPALVALADHNLEQGAASMRAARGAGVKIALGSDMTLGVPLEIQRMIHHGDPEPGLRGGDHDGRRGPGPR